MLCCPAALLPCCPVALPAALPTALPAALLPSLLPCYHTKRWPLMIYNDILPSQTVTWIDFWMRGGARKKQVVTIRVKYQTAWIVHVNCDADKGKSLVNWSVRQLCLMVCCFWSFCLLPANILHHKNLYRLRTMLHTIAQTWSLLFFQLLCSSKALRSSLTLHIIIWMSSG